MKKTNTKTQSGDDLALIAKMVIATAVVLCSYQVYRVMEDGSNVHVVDRGLRVEKYTMLELFANTSMDWKVSTTPIPISAPSVIIKAIMAKEMENIPEELQHLAQLDTIPVQAVRDFTNKQRYRMLVEMCSGQNRVDCERWVNQADPEFGMTPLHLAYASGDYQMVDMLKSMGAGADVMDNAGRKPQNLSFANFVKNSKKFAKAAGRTDCDIPVVEVKTMADLLEIKRLVNEGEPVLMKNVLSMLSSGVDLAKMTIPQLVELYADSNVTIGEVPYADVFRLAHSVTKLKDFYNDHVLTDSSTPLYIFRKHHDITSAGLTALSELVEKAFPEDVICPVEYGNTGKESIHFFLGAKNSGAPFHVHADAINLVVFGGKRWFLYPPTQSLYSRKHISRWLQEDYVHTEAKPLECMQGSGDVVYIPFDWSHAVINTDQTFGYALELLNRREILGSLPSMLSTCI